MLTVRALAADMGLQLAAGEQAAEAPLRWVHISELPDPTPWLSGGELLLTTGIQLTTEALQRDFVRRLAAHHLAGLGFGTGFDHEALPAALLDEARRHGFPVFEVPYELPFLAITETAFAQLVNEQFDVLQRAVATGKRLERLVLEERGLDELARALAAALGGPVAVLSAGGDTLASASFRRPLPAATLAAVRAELRGRAADPPDEFAPNHPDIAGRSLVLPVATRGRGAPEAWLAAARDAGGLGDFERLVLQQATIVVALELMRQRAMRDTERRLAGDVLAEALSGRLEEVDLVARLRPFGVGPRTAVLVFPLEAEGSGAGDNDARAGAPLEARVERALAEAGVPALVATRGRLVCAVVDAREGLDPVELAARARAAAGAGCAAVSRPAEPSGLRRAFHEARCALEAASLSNGAGPEVASWRDLGAFQLLLSLQDDEALRLYCDSVLGPLEGGDYGDELIRSLEAFIEQNGQWERAARELYCHRHTLRYRIRRVEQLTGRNLASARDRIEFWLALRGRELVA